MDQEEILNEAVYSPLVLEFLAVAQKYCLFIEQIDRLEKNKIFDGLSKALPLLYVKGALLPDIEAVDISQNEKYVTAEQWQDVFNDLREKIGNDDEYWFNENDNPDNELVKGSLSDNLTDIYQDMKDFVLLYQKPVREAKKVAVWEIKKLFFSHWGFRIVNVIKVLHYLLYGEYNDRDSGDFDDF
jgi:uncharacterized protein (UPF0335 family)